MAPTARFVVTIATNNDAFKNGNRETEVARILRALADFIDGNYLPTVAVLRDINGNRVGTAETVDKRAI